MYIKNANEARVENALAKKYNYHGATMSMQQIIEQVKPMVTCITDGMIDYSRTTFNRMDGREQAVYTKRLQDRRLYFVNDIKVPKVVHDWAAAQPDSVRDPNSLPA